VLLVYGLSDRKIPAGLRRRLIGRRGFRGDLASGWAFCVRVQLRRTRILLCFAIKAEEW